MKKKIFTIICLFLLGRQLPAQTTLVPFGANWKYLDNGSDQGTLWKESSFSDAAWKTGRAPLGYGSGEEEKVIGYGGSKSQKHTTSYFRYSFSVADTAGITGYRVSVKRDDGAVVYINGKEVYRTNMPGGVITHTTKANDHAVGDGASPVKKSLPAGILFPGRNTIAVEVHQATNSSADMFFDLELAATMLSSQPPGGNDGEGGSGEEEPQNPGGDGAELTRGPYLQVGNATGVTLRWRTDKATDSKIEVGTKVGVYTLSATDATKTVEHILRIDSLKPDTKYYYRFGSTASILQGDSTHFFRTAPPANTNRNIRIAVFGDCGQNARNRQTGTLKAYQDYVGNKPGELLLIPGDLAYDDGKDAEFQKYFFNVYSPNILRNHVLFPAPGNHDYHTTSNTARTAPYFKNFTFPTNGESGGVPSGAKNYYSVDWGNIHVLCLDSYGMESDDSYLYDTTGKQATWMKKDLAANTREWVVVILHHPPYSKGDHDSDVEGALKRIRARVVPIWERYGVDLVVGAHSHNYERSFLLRGHYDQSSSFKASKHATSNSSAKYNGSSNSCPYVTYAGPGKDKGIVYVVAGSAGAYSAVQKDFPHKAQPFAFADGGSLFLEVEGNRLDGKFLRMDGTTADRFTLMHSVNRSVEVPAARGHATQLTASWRGNYKWSTGETSRSIRVNPGATTAYSVVDEYGCIADSFLVEIGGAASLTADRAEAEAEMVTAAPAFRVYPNLVERGQRVSIRSGSPDSYELLVVDQNGRVVRTLRFRGFASLETGQLPSGTYFLKMKGKDPLPGTRFIVTR
ncbi:metallophosphoesterase [Paraflavisolibacter sp. H34]|uniref:metallophosphoesterase n=1 Tax=Huijunlia imazamoxiresistens TaxID=3127457 RepID=UPI0030173BC7